MLKKILSRKFLAALAGIIAGIAMVFGLDADIITTVSGAVVAVVSAASYIIVEGKIDVQSVSLAAEKLKAAQNSLEG